MIVFSSERDQTLLNELHQADMKIIVLSNLLRRWRKAFRLQCGDNSPLLRETNEEIGTKD